MLKKAVIHIRQQSPQVKKRVALVISLVITAIIALVFVFAFVQDIDRRNQKKQSGPIIMDSSPTSLEMQRSLQQIKAQFNSNKTQ